MASTPDPSHGGEASAKKTKIDFSNDLKLDVTLADLNPEQIPSIFQHVRESSVRAIESCFSHELHDGYVDLQFRLARAQRPIEQQLLQTRCAATELPPPKFAWKLARLLRDLASSPETSTAVKDALRYYEAACIGYAAFSQYHTQGIESLKKHAGGIDPIQYFKQLVEASERHLKQHIDVQTNASHSTDDVLPIPVPAARIQSALVPVVSSSNTEYSPWSDEYLKDKVTSFVVGKEELGSAIPWDHIDDCGSQLKRTLKRDLLAIQSGRQYLQKTPAGILLHGDQGTGKTTIVKSFTAYHDLRLFKVTPAIHGSLRGQSEKLLQYVFQAIRAAAAVKPCVLFIDEADGLLRSSSTESSTFEAMFKQLWGDMIEDNVRCFVFGATNKPWNINMGDYSRRFSTKIHVRAPGHIARKAIIKHCLIGLWHTIDDADLTEIVTVVWGYSTNDIAKEISVIARELYFEMCEAKRWVVMRGEGSEFLVPATEAETDIFQGSCDDFENAEPRPVQKETIISWFEQGKAKKTCSAEEEQKHREWNRKWSR